MLLQGLMGTVAPMPCQPPRARVGRGSALARVRMATRRMLGF